MEHQNHRLSGEGFCLKSVENLAGDEQQNIDPKVTMSIAREVAAVNRLGIEVILKTFFLYRVSVTMDSAILNVNAEVGLKATNVDGVFEDDPKRNPNACLHQSLTFQEVTSKDLSVMDMTAITLCQENNIPDMVFNLSEPGNIAKAIKGERVVTLIGGTWNTIVATT